MPRKYVILPAIAIGLIAPSWAGTVYTREEAVKIALEKSTEIQSAQEDLVSTTSQVDAVCPRWSQRVVRLAPSQSTAQK